MSAPKIPSETRTVVPIHFQITGGRSTTTAGMFSTPQAAIVKMTMPQRGYLIRAAARVVGTGGNASPTITVDVQKNSVSVLSTPIGVSTPAGVVVGAVAEGSLSLAATNDVGVLFAKDDVLTVDINITGGSSPTADRFDVDCDFVPFD